MNLRNPVEANFSIESFNSIFERLKENHPNFKAPEALDISREESIKMVLSTLNRAIKYCADLKFKLLVNKTNHPFILGDNPSIIYNQFFEQKKIMLGGSGNTCLGLQLLMPLSPDTMVLFYDSWAYKIGDRRKNILEITDTNDICSLNLLQVLNCSSNLYFNEKVSESYIRQLMQKAKSHSKAHKVLSKSLGRFILLGSNDTRINLSVAGMTLTKNAKFYNPSNTVLHMRPYAQQIMQKDKELKPAKLDLQGQAKHITLYNNIIK